MKGAETRANILDEALAVARREGLGALSIGKLAKGVGLSKSGLFAHFKSKEALQLDVLSTAVATFVETIVLPALKEPRGEPRVRALFENWLKWANTGPGGCVFLGAAVEYDDRPGPLRDYLVRTQRDWIRTLTTAADIARAEGHLRADVDTEQFAFEVYGVLMAHHLYGRLLRDGEVRIRARRALDSILERAR